MPSEIVKVQFEISGELHQALVRKADLMGVTDQEVFIFSLEKFLDAADALAKNGWEEIFGLIDKYYGR